MRNVYQISPRGKDWHWVAADDAGAALACYQQALGETHHVDIRIMHPDQLMGLDLKKKSFEEWAAECSVPTIITPR